MTAKQDIGRLTRMLYSARKPTRWIGGIALGVLFSAVALPALLPACTPLEDNKLARVKSTGELTVLTRRSPSTYFETADGPSGFEYDLMRAFTDSLGVRLKVIVAERYPDVLTRLEQGDADMASAGIRQSAATPGGFLFSTPYHEVLQQVVCRQGT